MTADAFSLAYTWKEQKPFPYFSELHTDTTWPAPGSSYVWCRMFIDMDYEWAALLRVNTIPENAGTEHLEVVDHIGVFMMDRKLQVEWHNSPRLFFDGDCDWVEDAQSWLVGRVADDSRRGWADSIKPTSTFFYNRGIERRDRERARALGIHLPYLNLYDRPCRNCGELLHMADGKDWLDDFNKDHCADGAEHAPR